MAKHRIGRRSRRHYGVKLLTLADGRHVARWKDPLSGKLTQESLDRLGLRTVEARTVWATQKADALAAVRQAVASGGAAAARQPLTQAVADYLARYGNRGSMLNKRIVLDALAAWAEAKGVRDAQDLAPPILAGWRDHVLRPASEHQTSTKNRWLLVTVGFVNWLREQGLAPTLSTDDVRRTLRRAKQEKGEIEFLRPPELVKLLKATLRHDADGRQPVAPLVLLAVLTGMRSEELRGLCWDEVDAAAGEIRLPADRVKTKAARTIRLAETPMALELLAALRLRTPGPLVFPHVAGGARGTWEAAQQRLVDTYKAPRFTLHTLRRTCGTLLTNAPGVYGGASAFLSAKRLGHSVAVAEKHYAGALPGLPAEARTLEAAAGIEDVARDIIAAAGGTVAGARRRIG